MSQWTAADIPDQTGRLVIVTGANTGIGYETALALARNGATVILACRDARKGEAAVARIRAAAPGAGAECRLLDLADLESVADFTKDVCADHAKLDLLILNAGVMVPPHSRTEQGYELQFGVNHLGHFALAGRLLPLLQAGAEARVVAVSSTAARRGALDLDDLHFDRRGYHAWHAYGQSKLANQLYVREFQRRLAAVGSRVLVTAAHPGWTATELQRNSPITRFFGRFFAMEPAQGALPTLRAATDPDAGPADYFGPDGFLQMRGRPERVPMLPRALDDAVAARLWEISEDLTGVKYGLPAAHK